MTSPFPHKNVKLVIYNIFLSIMSDQYFHVTSVKHFGLDISGSE